MESNLSELRQELETLERENRHLRERLRHVEDERHQRLVDTAMDARFRAGLAKDRRAESERLVGLDDATLELMVEDAERVAERLARAKPHGPKTRYASNTVGTFEAAVEDMREQLFGHRREVGGR
jgi:predicted  nucleic acid-binding Zn-ribbon protein